MQIESPHNSRVKEWSSLLEKKHRDKTRKFLIEGTHLVQEALKAKADIEVVAFSIDRGIPPELASAAADSLGVEWIGVSEAVIAKCSDTKTPQPVFAVVRKEHSGAALDGLLRRPDSLVAVLDGVQDPGNVGTIIRSADAVGADAVIVGKGCADLYGPKTIRSTMGSLFHLPVLEGNLAELLPLAKQHGIRIAGTSLQSASSCYSYDFKGPHWLLFGSEGSGLSRGALEMLDDALIIPMQGKAESLNVAMAASVLLFEAQRQRHF